MTAYSLLEEPSVTKNPAGRSWKIAMMVVGGIIITFSFIIVTQVSKKDLPINTTAPERFLSFNVPTQQELYYLDLDKYPIEDNLLKLFSDSKASIESVAIQNLLHETTDIDWTDRWLQPQQQDINREETTLSCDKQPVPYPILRQIVSEYIPNGNPDSSYDVKSNLDFDKPFVVLPFAKQPRLVQGQKLCVRVVVPYQNKGGNGTYHLLYKPYDHNNRKISSPWWDTMMTTIKDRDTNATLPIQMEPWSGHQLIRHNARILNNPNDQRPEWAQLREDEMYERGRMHIYESTVTLPQAGTWDLASLLEFVEARYNFEFGPVTPYQPTSLSIYPAGGETIVISSSSSSNSEDRKNKTQSLHQKLLKQHLSLPLCKGSDHAGRWLSWPKKNDQEPASQSNYANKQDLKKVMGLTRDGKYWAPYDCRYRHLSYEAFNRCAAKKYTRGMDLYGDSNIRRSVKKFLSHGQWCKDWHQHIQSPLLPEDQLPLVDLSVTKRQEQGYQRPEDYRFISEAQTRSCYCEDFAEEHWKQEWFNANARRFDLQFANSLEQSEALGRTEWDDQVMMGNTTRDSIPVNSYKWDGLTYLNNPHWDTAVPSSTKPADIAIFSLGNWDAAFAQLSPFLNDVDRLIAQIKEHYDLSKTRIIYRTAQYYCCRIDGSGRTRQVSGPRMQVFEQETKAKFQSELNATIWDTYTMAESKSWEEKIVSISCPSNHAPADQVEIENQVLMNGLCNNI
ncbi:hypothetical protein HPULCUR_001013 [Helicostylum pulchrum]|uniref:Uncharacterized protein n=1 Tax=Helicostylum pulchrum TaxID=562976 RepID=A0ABP9XLI7_9FUNG